MSQLIASHEREIEERWAERVNAEGGDGPGLGLALHEYLHSLADTLSHAHQRQEETDVWQKSAKTVTRRRFDVLAVIRELELLRDVMLEAAAGEGKEGLLGSIVSLFDVPIAATVASYIAARDHELRLCRSEHLSFLTHELRNPLATAFLAAAQLRRMGLPSRQLERTADLIVRSLSRLRDLIESAAS